jgi:hypothetical protein
MPHTSEILNQLVKLNAKYAELHNDYENVVSKLDQITEILTGNGAPDKGLIIRFDRIEQESKRRNVWLKTAISAAVASVIGVVGTLVKIALMKG